MDKKKKSYRIIIVFVAALMLSSVLISVLFATLMPTPVEKEYLEFLENVENDEVEKVVLYGDKGYLTYKLKEDETIYTTAHPLTQTFKESLLLKGIPVTHGKTPSFNFSYILYIVYFLVIVLMLKTLATNIMPTSRNVELMKNIKVNFSDVAGMTELKEELLTVADLMKNKKYRDAGVKVPKGILLYGPPGNGKTYIAKAFAGETGLNMIAVNASDMGSQFVGLGSANVRNLFKAASQNAPCVIFIDEIDALGARRANHSDATSKEFNTILTTLLAQMDGIDNLQDVFVIGATNRPESLDEALLRPGRFDKQFAVNYPDKQSRIDILSHYLQDHKLDETVKVEDVAALTFNHSSSSLTNIVNEALIKMAFDGREILTMEDFREAIAENDTHGKTKKNQIDSEKRAEEKKRVAYHEAGHAIIGKLMLNKEIAQISILPTTSGVGGFTMFKEDEDNNLLTLKDMEEMICELLGGRAAEYILYDYSANMISVGASNDIERATKIAKMYVNTQAAIDFSGFNGVDEKVLSEVSKVLTECWDKTVSFLTTNKEELDKLAEYLLEHEIYNNENH